MFWFIAVSYTHLDAHILVLELRVDQRADRRGGGAGLVRAGGDRNAFADLHRRLLLVGAANARIVQNLGVRVVQQYIELGRTDGDCKIRGLQVGQIIKRRRGGCLLYTSPESGVKTSTSCLARPRR